MFRYQHPRPLSDAASLACLHPDRSALSAGQRATSQEELEEDLQPFRRREDAQLAGAGVCTAPLQAHAALLHGRDRRRAGLQERLHRGLLHLREFGLLVWSRRMITGGTNMRRYFISLDLTGQKYSYQYQY